MDEAVYIRKQEAEGAEYEARCRRCGACCGADGADPCANLARETSGAYFCKSYDTRIGVQRTVSGRTFTCIPIRDVRRFGMPFEGCGYNST
jgi:hypothetical protein